MGRKYRFHDITKIHFITLTVVHWIDVFIRDEYRDVIYKSIEHCQIHKGLDVYGYCMMPSHLHMIVGSEKGVLPDIVRDFKAFTSRHIRKQMENHPGESKKEWMLWMMKRAGLKNERNKDWQFWQQHNHPIELNNYEIFVQRLNYTHNNPVASGFVEKPEDWLHSSAADYFGVRKGRVDLSFLDV